MEATSQRPYKGTDPAGGVDRRAIEEQERLLVQRARAGDLAACEAIIMRLQGWIESVARQCARKYGRRSILLEAEDLIQVGNVALLENLERALSVERPFAYLITVVSLTVRRYCCSQGRLGTLARGASDMQVCSLDFDFHFDFHFHFQSLATGADELAGSDEARSKWEPLYRAVEALPARQREIITRSSFQFQSLAEISRDLYGSKTACGAVSYHRNKAISTLRGSILV